MTSTKEAKAVCNLIITADGFKCTSCGEVIPDKIAKDLRGRSCPKCGAGVVKIYKCLS